MAHILIAAYGSRGDILPLTDVGCAPRDAGHEVVLTAPPDLVDDITRCGLQTRPVDFEIDADFDASKDDALKLAMQMVKPKGMRQLGGNLLAALQDVPAETRGIPSMGNRTPCSGCGRPVASATAPPVAPPRPGSTASTAASRPTSGSNSACRSARHGRCAGNAPPSSGRSCTASPPACLPAHRIGARPRRRRRRHHHHRCGPARLALRQGRGRFTRAASAQRPRGCAPGFPPSAFPRPAGTSRSGRAGSNASARAPRPCRVRSSMPTNSAPRSAPQSPIRRTARVPSRWPRRSSRARREDRGRSGRGASSPLTYAVRCSWFARHHNVGRRNTPWGCERNPVRFRDCPAAVSGNDRRHDALGIRLGSDGQ